MLRLDTNVSSSRAAGPHRRGSRTRERLVETAGRLFAEQGIDRVTGQAICRRAGVHSAAIVYHFGGMRGLHQAVLAEAQRRMLSTETLAAAVAAERDPRRQLQAFLGAIVQVLTGPDSQSWAVRLFGREFVAPSAVYGPRHDRLLAERARILRGIIGSLTGLVPTDPAVARAAISVMAPCAVLLVFNHRKLARLLPDLHLGATDAPQITAQLVSHALAGLQGLRGR
jgi:AcrR family transcriptional regulator